MCLIVVDKFAELTATVGVIANIDRVNERNALEIFLDRMLKDSFHLADFYTKDS